MVSEIRLWRGRPSLIEVHLQLPESRYIRLNHGIEVVEGDSSGSHRDHRSLAFVFQDSAFSLPVERFRGHRCDQIATADMAASAESIATSSQ